MNEWTVGFVPRGWVRGEAVEVVPSSRTRRGYVRRAFRLNFDTPISADPIRGDDVYAISFEHDAAKRVDAWLKWWQA